MSVHEQEALKEFAAMSLNEVRRRADEFEVAQREYKEWLKTRRANRKRPIDADEMSGYAPEVQYGDPARRWRKLEAHMRDSGAWTVGDLGTGEATTWARRLNALSDALGRPTRRPLGRPVTPEIRRED